MLFLIVLGGTFGARNISLILLEAQLIVLLYLFIYFILYNFAGSEEGDKDRV